MSSFDNRRLCAAKLVYQAVYSEMGAANHRHSAAVEIGRNEEIREAHNEAIEAYARMLQAYEDMVRIALEVNGINPDLRHIP